MLSDMATTGLHGAELAQITPGDSVVVIGIGPVGLMSVAGAVILGAGRLFAVGSRPRCIEVAEEFGATDIVNYREGDIVDQVLEATRGERVDRVVVATWEPSSRLSISSSPEARWGMSTTWVRGTTSPSAGSRVWSAWGTSSSSEG